jgi:flagellar hook protein FlgE
MSARVGGTAEKTTRAGVNANLRSEQPVVGRRQRQGRQDRRCRKPPPRPRRSTTTVYLQPDRRRQPVFGRRSAGRRGVATGKVGYDPTTGALVGSSPAGRGHGGNVTDTVIRPGDRHLADLGLATNADAKLGKPTTRPPGRCRTTPGPTKGVKPDFEIQVPVSDSKGGQRTVTLSLLKGPGPNEWYAELRAKPGDLDNNANGLISSGKITFTTDGKLQSTGNLFGAPPDLDLDQASGTPSDGPAGVTPALAAADLGRRPGHRHPGHPDRPGQRRRRPDPVQQPVGRPVGQHQRHGLR